MNRRFRKQKAFTLIELLVVLSIVMLIIAILLPALGRARDRARQITCAAQLKGITLGQMLYATDNNQWGIPGIQWGDTQALANAHTWISNYFPDEIAVEGIRVKPTFRCPDRDPRGDAAAPYQFGSLQSNRLATTYFFHFGTGTRPWTDINSYYGNILYQKSTAELPAVNVPNLDFLGTIDTPAWVFNSYKPIFIPAPSDQPAAQDTYSGVEDGSVQWRRNGTLPNHIFNNNHFRQGGHNVSYADGHVKWLNDEHVRTRHRDYHNRFYY